MLFQEAGFISKACTCLAVVTQDVINFGGIVMLLRKRVSII